jgi:hypothetical protein
MGYVIKQFNDVNALQDYLNGVVLGGPLPPIVYGLDGLTLVIKPTQGQNITVTFSDTSNKGLSPANILAAVLGTSGMAGYASLVNHGYSNPKSPQLAITGASLQVLNTGTANSILGFPATTTTVTPVVKASIVDIQVNPTGPLYILITN